MKPCTFRPQPSKSFNKKICSEKIAYIFSKESFSYISGNGTLHFSGQKFTSRKFFILQQQETPKALLIFSQKKAVIMFREVTFRVRKMKKPAPKKLLMLLLLFYN